MILYSEDDDAIVVTAAVVTTEDAGLDVNGVGSLDLDDRTKLGLQEEPLTCIEELVARAKDFGIKTLRRLLQVGVTV